MKLRQLPRNIWVMTVASFFTDVSTELIVHLIPLFLVNVLGARVVTVGLIEGVAETTASLLKIASGWLSDFFGRRKWITIAGYALSTIAKPFFLIANSWQIIFAVRFTERFGKGIRSAPRDALIADSIDEHHRGYAFGIHKAGDTAGAALGLLFALIIVGWWQGSELTLEQATFHTAVYASLIPAILAVLILAFGIREVASTTEIAKVHLNWRGLSRPFQHFLLIVILFTLGNSSDAFLILRAQERGQSVLSVMVMLMVFNIIYATIAGPATALSDKIGRRRLLLAGWLLYAFIYIGFALAQTIWHIWLLFCLYGLYNALTQGSAKAFVADLVPMQQRGTAYGLYHAAVGISALPASVLAGILWQGIGQWPGFGPQAPFIFGAILASLAAVLIIVWLPEKVKI